MRTFFAQPFSESCNNQDVSSDNSIIERNISAPHKSQNKAVFVQLEIQIAVLQQLIVEDHLVAEELRCLNNKSKNIVRRALLNSLVSHNRPDLN